MLQRVFIKDQVGSSFQALDHARHNTGMVVRGELDVSISVCSLPVDLCKDPVSFLGQLDIQKGECSLYLLFVCELYGGVDGLEYVVEGFKLFLLVGP